MCWSKYGDLQLKDEEEEVRRLEAAAEKRVEKMLSKKRKEAREPVRS